MVGIRKPNTRKQKRVEIYWNPFVALLRVLCLARSRNTHNSHTIRVNYHTGMIYCCCCCCCELAPLRDLQYIDLCYRLSSDYIFSIALAPSLTHVYCCIRISHLRAISSTLLCRQIFMSTTLYEYIRIILCCLYTVKGTYIYVQSGTVV